MTKKLNKDGRQQKLAGAIGKFVQQYARKAYPTHDPNDRTYDRKLEQKIRRMKPEALDALMRLGDEDT
jgi:hypothetical protein